MLLIPDPLSILTLLPLLLSYSRIVKCFPTNETAFLTLPPSLGTTRPSCAGIQHFPDWYQPSEKFDYGDCDKAINLFYSDYVKDHESTRYEFLASGVDPVHGIPTQRVPFKVGSGTCVVVIAMRSQFKQGQLPNETPFRSARSDISSFRKLYLGVEEINGTCVGPEGQPGWYETGEYQKFEAYTV